MAASSAESQLSDDPESSLAPTPVTDAKRTPDEISGQGIAESSSSKKIRFTTPVAPALNQQMNDVDDRLQVIRRRQGELEASIGTLTSQISTLQAEIDLYSARLDAPGLTDSQIISLFQEKDKLVRAKDKLVQEQDKLVQEKDKLVQREMEALRAALADQFRPAMTFSNPSSLQNENVVERGIITSMPPIASPMAWAFLDFFFRDPAHFTGHQQEVFKHAQTCTRKLWNFLASAGEDKFLKVATKFESTLNGLLMVTLSSVFGETQQSLLLIPEFAYRNTEKSSTSDNEAIITGSPPMADGIGFSNGRIFLVVETKRTSASSSSSSQTKRTSASSSSSVASKQTTPPDPIIAQIGRECSNFVAGTKTRQHFLTLSLMASAQQVDFAVDLLVSAKVLPGAPNFKPFLTFHQIRLAKGVASANDDNLSRLMGGIALAGFGAAASGDHQFNVSRATTIYDSMHNTRINISFFNNFWIKVFPEQSQRRAAINLAQIPGAHLVVDTPSLKVMRYPNIEGTVEPATMTPQLFLHAAQALATLHQQGIVHGDVRMYNLVVDPPTRRVQWIDFDFAIHKSERGRYPSNWNRDITDGERHPAANAEEPIEECHDVFAFLAMVKLYQKDCLMVAETMANVILWLEQQQPLDQEWPLRAATTDGKKQGTGSPPKMTKT
jgi:hypothetical protein